MAYYVLDEKNIIDYIKSLPEMAERFSADAQLDIIEVGDGNLNLVFIIKEVDAPENAVILKQALPYLRVAGDSWPLTRERMRYETQALLKQYEVAPGLVPAIYAFDHEMSMVVMEYLDKHEIMRKPLVARKRFPKFTDHISTFLVNSLFYTSDLYLGGVEKKLLMATFVNEQLRKLQEDFVYTNPYMESEENNWNALLDAEVQDVRHNAELKMAIADIKNDYMNNSQALIHADLHTGSIMLNQEDTRVIDPEFAFFGPMAYDIAAILQNLILNYASHFAHTKDPVERADYQNYLLETVRGIWNEFARKFDETWAANNKGELVPQKYWDFPGGEAAFAEYRRRYIARILQGVAAHGGVKFLRRMMGIVSVWDLSSIEDPQKRAVAEKFSIQVGIRWILASKTITSIDQLLDIVREETANLA
ncbi:MAG: S-methyl-5-thioribose kinase [Anaerolineaceae bacterium 4572_5.2]|nr:MAG: S-methyl-5-thioribose kinase [Anaerolineaceae bacterium 4572_5.2]